MELNQLEKEYKERLNSIENEINKIIPDVATQTWIKANAGSDLIHLDPTLATEFNKPAWQLISRGGKRWRPMLMLLSAELAAHCENKHDLCTATALALSPLVELPHNGSLIVDDIEDHSDFRRGEPAVHMIYGEDASINAGNLIYFLPTTLIETASLDANQRAKIYEIYCRCMRRLHFGQGMDIQWHNHPDFFPTQPEYETMCRLKTGALSRMAAEMGYTLGGGSPEKAQLLASIAETLGLAFQIRDDIINLTTGNIGKKRGDDIVERKRSLPIILFAQKNETTQLINLMNEAHSHGIDKANDAVEAAIRLVSESGALSEAQSYAQSLISTSLNQLKTNFPASDALNLISWMFESF